MRSFSVPRSVIKHDEIYVNTKEVMGEAQAENYALFAYKAQRSTNHNAVSISNIE